MWHPDPRLAAAVLVALTVMPTAAQETAPAGDAAWAPPTVPEVLRQDVQRAPAAAPVPLGVMPSLDSIETSTMVLEALARNAEARAEVCRLGGPAAAMVCDGVAPIRPAVAGSGMAGVAEPDPAVAREEPLPPPLPRVAEIAGARGTLSARLLLPDGGAVTVRPGMDVGDLTITAISPQRVDARRGTERLHLPFAR